MRAHLLDARAIQQHLADLLGGVHAKQAVSSAPMAGDDVEGALGPGAIIREHGANGTIPYRIEVFEPPSKIVTRIADPSLGFGGTWTFEVFQNDSGSELVLTENGEIYNPIFRVLGKFFFSPYETIDTYMADLKRKVGE